MTTLAVALVATVTNFPQRLLRAVGTSGTVAQSEGTQLLCNIPEEFRTANLLNAIAFSSGEATIIVPDDEEIAYLQIDMGNTGIYQTLADNRGRRHWGSATQSGWALEWTKPAMSQIIVTPDDQFRLLVPATDSNASPTGIWVVAATFEVIQYST